MTRKYLDMNQHDALYKVARAYPGGIDAGASDGDFRQRPAQQAGADDRLALSLV
jgi:hypothetical protein